MTRWPLAAVLVAAGGCGRGATPPAPVYPVAGRVGRCDRPAGNVHVAFHPVGRGGACPAGVSRPDGTFTLTTYARRGGSPVGEYVVPVFRRGASTPTRRRATISRESQPATLS